MLAGKQFKLHKATLAIDIIEGKRVAVTIPVGEIVTVVGNPQIGHATVDIFWAGRVVVMFAVDVEGRGTETVESFRIARRA